MNIDITKLLSLQATQRVRLCSHLILCWLVFGARASRPYQVKSKEKERRESLLGGKYRRALARLDQRFHETALHEAAPQHLPQLCPNHYWFLYVSALICRKILSCAFVRSQVSCLLARMGHLDVGARKAAAMRQVVVW